MHDDNRRRHYDFFMMFIMLLVPYFVIFPVASAIRNQTAAVNDQTDGAGE